MSADQIWNWIYYPNPQKGKERAVCVKRKQNTQILGVTKIQKG